MVDRLSPLGDPGRYLLSAYMRKTGTRYLLRVAQLGGTALEVVAAGKGLVGMGTARN